MLRLRKLIRIVAVNLLLLTLIFVVFSFGLRAWLIWYEKEILNPLFLQPAPNTIIAGYPNFRNLSKDEALSIMLEGGNVPGSYVSFTAWQRVPYSSPVANVEPEFRTRLSTGHSKKDSVWFVGGSTVWGWGARDENTIPSYFSSITGEKVWNLGEYAYFSFQGLVQLQIMLARGFVPKAVVFYEGINEMFHCRVDAGFSLIHGHYVGLERAIANYDRLKAELESLTVEPGQSESFKKVNLTYFFVKITQYFLEPFLDFYDIYLGDRALGISIFKRLATDKKLSEYKRKGIEQICGGDPDHPAWAASMLVETWLLSHDILSQRGIPSYYFLQPAAYIEPENSQLDYLIDYEKQALVDQKASFEARYRKTKKAWGERCKAHDACDKFFDISRALVDFGEPVFLDRLHISANGNEHIAKIMADIVLKDR